VAAARQAGARVRLSVHDYYAICPRVNFVAPNGRYCGEPTEPADCNRCLAQDGLATSVGPIDEWRRRSMKLLSVCHQVVAPSEDVASRLRRFSDGLQVDVTPHDEPEVHVRLPDPPAPGQTVRVLAIGAISRIKGYDVLMGLAEVAQQRVLPLQVSLLGYSMDDPRLAMAGVSLLGRYFDNELQDKIAEHDPHVILIPSIWPETYCYVLSTALASGRPVAVFDIGAQATRSREHGPHHLVAPLSLVDTPSALADLLLEHVHAPTRGGELRVAA
jgi:glycosyltransferase involved in cell wall biosynthesis